MRGPYVPFAEDYHPGRPSLTPSAFALSAERILGVVYWWLTWWPPYIIIFKVLLLRVVILT